MFSKMKEIMFLVDIDQKQLAALTGISRTSITMYANGHIEPSISRALRIAKALGHDVNDIWKLEHDKEWWQA